MNITLKQKEDVTGASKEILEKVENEYGFIPNIYAAFAESPAAAAAYYEVNRIIHEHVALSRQEQQIVMLTISEHNKCEYCVAAHTTLAGMNNVGQDTVKALREGGEPSDAKQAALVRFTRSVLDHQGWVPEPDQNALLDAGYTPRHALDVLTIIALKTLSNYTNHISGTPVDEAFASNRWSRE